MTQNKIQIGDNAHFVNSPVVAGAIQNSFNQVEASSAGAELKTALKQLHEAIAELSKHLEPEAAEQAARDLESLAREATSKKPRREWYELSAKGLVEAAKAVATMAPSVVTAVQAVVKLLGG